MNCLQIQWVKFSDLQKAEEKRAKGYGEDAVINFWIGGDFPGRAGCLPSF